MEREKYSELTNRLSEQIPVLENSRELTEKIMQSVHDRPQQDKMRWDYHIRWISSSVAVVLLLLFLFQNGNIPMKVDISQNSHYNITNLPTPTFDSENPVSTYIKDKQESVARKKELQLFIQNRTL